MTVVYYQKLICILLIDDVIIGPWGYKYGSYPHNDHPWWRHQTGVSKRWVMKSNFFKTRVASNYVWFITWLCWEFIYRCFCSHQLLVRSVDRVNAYRKHLFFFGTGDFKEMFTFYYHRLKSLFCFDKYYTNLFFVDKISIQEGID